MIERTVRARECARDGCSTRYDDLNWDQPWPKKFCSAECARGKGRATIPTKRKPISVASKEQAAKRNAGVSIVSGASEGLDAAHLCPRGLGGCDDPDCTIPLTRYEHTMFDKGKLDLLPYLVPGHVDEIAHALHHYRGDVPALLERLTGCKWQPVSGVPVEQEGREAA
jgi:hypothetical protein